MKLNSIRRFFYLSAKYFRVYPTLYKEKFLYPNIKVFYSKTRKIFLTFKTLKILTKSTYNTTFILETNKGVLTHRDAIKYGVGGILVSTVL